MENTTSTNNLNNEFTTTTTNAVEITPATDCNLTNQYLNEIEKQKFNYNQLSEAYSSMEHDYEIVKNKLATLNCNTIETISSIYQAALILLKQMDVVDIANLIHELPNKTSEVVKHLTNLNFVDVKEGINNSYNKEKFETEIEDLETYISDKYSCNDIVDLIDNKYSWHTILNRAFTTHSIDENDVIDHIDMDDAINEELRKGNFSFSDIMEHFDKSDCFEYLNDNGDLNWYEVKDYVDMDDVKADIEIDSDMIADYISGLNDNQFRTLITNLS